MRRTRLLSLAVVGLAAIFVFTATLPASAVAGEWSYPVTLSEAGQSAINPQLVTDGTTITAAWTRSDGSNYRIQAATSVDGGLTWSAPATLSEAGLDSSVPQLVTDGTITTVTWYANDGEAYLIYAATSSDGGVNWSTPATLSDPGYSAFDPELVTDGGSITVTWYRYDGSTHRVQAATSVDGGLTWGDPATLSEAGQDSSDPQLVTDGSTIMATWSRLDGSNNRIQVASSVDNGLNWRTPATLSEAGGNARSPQLVRDGPTITAIWSRSDGSNDRVQASSSVDEGITWSTPATLSEVGGDAVSPQLVTDGTTITATWTWSDEGGYRVQVASSTDGGITWSTPATPSAVGGGAGSPQLVTDGTTITATWTRSEDSTYRVQVTSSTDGGLTWSTPATLSEAGQGTSHPQLVTDGTTITATWYSYDGSNNRVQVATLVTLGDEATKPELAATGAQGTLAVGLLAGGLFLAGALLVAARTHGRRTA